MIAFKAYKKQGETPVDNRNHPNLPVDLLLSSAYLDSAIAEGNAASYYVNVLVVLGCRGKADYQRIQHLLSKDPQPKLAAYSECKAHSTCFASVADSQTSVATN